MYFVIFATDKGDHQEVRAAERPRHRAYLQDPGHTVKVRAAGPTLAADGETMNGSMLVLEAEEMAAVEAFAAGDPYNQAGLFESVVIRPFNWVIGKPDGA
jgi:uncharacterized protein YciI